MTKRRSLIRKRGDSIRLCPNVELWAAGYFGGFWREPDMDRRQYWEAVAEHYGAAISDKLRAAAPGCRPGYQYAIGILPPIPLLAGPPPADHTAAREFIAIDGVAFWYAGPTVFHTWLKCQAEHLREIGEVDGAEWRHYQAWKRTGFEPGYLLEEGPSRPVHLNHVCF